jgi:hypothetical protein
VSFNAFYAQILVRSHNIKRYISLELFRVGGSRDEFIRVLNEVDPLFDTYNEIREYLESCEQNAIACLELGDNDKAQIYVHKMLDESFGIYYEKDDQDFYWTEWFVKLLHDNPDILKENSKKFIEGIATISKDRRGSSSMESIRSFLSSFIQYNPSMAYRLKKFFWDQSVIEFEPTMQAFLVAGFNDEETDINIPLELFHRIYLSHCKYPSSTVIKAFCNRLIKIKDNNRSKQILGDLLNSIEQNVSPKLYYRWRFKFEDCLYKIIGNEELLRIVKKWHPNHKPIIDHTPGSVTLIDGTTIDESVLLEKTKDFNNFIDILKNIKEDRFYSWSQLIDIHITRLDIKQTEDLLIALLNINRNGREVFALIDKLRILRESQKAKQYAQNILERSTSNGWMYSYDGGTRIEPYKILIMIDEEYRNKAFDHFMKDYIQDGFRPYYISSFLKNLVSVFWSIPPLEEIWKEVDDHFSQLREFKNPNIRISDEILLESSSYGSLSNVLLKCIFNIFEMKQPELREDSYKALINIYENVEETRQTIIDSIAKYLGSSQESVHEFRFG